MTGNAHVDKALQQAIHSLQQGNASAAEQTFNQLLSEYGDYSQVHHYLGLAYFLQNDFKKSKAAISHAITLDNRQAIFFYNLALAEQALGNIQEALHCYKKALVLDKSSALIYENYAGLLYQQAAYEEAIVVLQQALGQGIKTRAILASMATIHYASGEHALAVGFAEQALSLEDSPELRLVKAHALFQLGRLEEGWLEYEHRHLGGKAVSGVDVPSNLPMWQGQTLTNKRIMVLYGEGVGDQVLFAHILDELAKLAEDVHACCDTRLLRLYQNTYPHITFHACDPKLGIDLNNISVSVDYYCLLTDVVRYLRPTMTSFPNEICFLKADVELSAKWHDALKVSNAKLKVGIIWNSGKNSPGRDLFYPELKHWHKLFENKEIEWINLQYGDIVTDLKTLEDEQGVIVQQLPELDLFNDFDNLAAVLANLDIVIGPTIFTPHFAAALGAEVLMLLPKQGCFEAFGQDYFPLQPTVKLFKQAYFAKWDEVFIDVDNYLKERVGERKAC